MVSATQQALTSMKSLPDFSAISMDELEVSLKSILATVSDQLDELELSVTPTWEGTIDRLFQIMEPMTYSWAIVSFLKSAKDNDQLREIHMAVQPQVVAIQARVAQSKRLYEALIELKESSWSELSDVQRRLVEIRIRDAELGGVGLEGEKVERFKEIQQRLAELGTKFSNNIRDSVKDFGLLLTDAERVKGIPAAVLGVMAQNAAKDEGREEFDVEKGPWKVTTDDSIFAPVLRNADDRELRETIYRAYERRASGGKTDNRGVILEILQLRQEQAELLGYKNFAEMNFVRKMAGSAQEVKEFLSELREASIPAAQEHLEVLTAFAREKTGDPTYELHHWDDLYWHEKLREDRYGFSSEQLRRYFPYEQVLDGLFRFCHQMFGIRFEPADDEGSLPDPSVRLFKVLNEQGSVLGYLYLDAFTRAGEKRPGAWASFFLARHKEADGSVRIPSAWLVCNQIPPVGSTPSLMTFGEVAALFHETGHSLHNMLTEVEHAWVAGVRNVEWDAVEVPSTFMEFWCYDKENLMSFAREYETGEPLPDELFEKIKAARTFGSGLSMSYMLWYTDIDLELHDGFVPASSADIDRLVEEQADRDLVMKPSKDHQLLCGVEHLFNGGYAAGYYTYLWSEMLSVDIFYAFKGATSDEVREVGKRYRETFLALGGSKHPSEIFREFRGRDPQIWPMLDHLGLKAAEA